MRAHEVVTGHPKVYQHCFCLLLKRVQPDIRRAVEGSEGTVSSFTFDADDSTSMTDRRVISSLARRATISDRQPHPAELKRCCETVFLQDLLSQGQAHQTD